MTLFTRFLRENRRSLIVWSAALAALCLMYLPFYPSIGGPELAVFMRNIPQPLLAAFGMTDMFDGVGYTHGAIFGMLGTLLLTLAAVGWGTRAVAGDEGSGALEMTLSYPVTRTQVVLQRALALAVLTAAAALVTTLSVIVLAGPSQLGIAPGNALATGVTFWLLALAFGLVALTVGALTGDRGAATATAAAVAVAAYLAHTLGGQLATLRWLEAVSPFTWAFGNSPLRNGLSLAGAGLLLAGCAALTGVALWGINRRDIGA